MPKTKQEKEQTLQDLEDKIKRAKVAVFSDYYGLKVPEMEELRHLLKERGADYLVAKKTLLKIVLDKIGVKDADVKAMAGGLGIAIDYEDEVSTPKILAKFAASHDKMSINGGILENSYMDADRVKYLAKLPGKEELIARAIGSIRAPLSGLVNVLQGNLRGLVCALNAIRESKS